MVKRLKHWDLWLLALLIAAFLYYRWSLPAQTDPDAEPPERSFGNITAQHVALGMDAEEAREQLGGLDGAAYNLGDRLVFIDFGGLDRLELKKDPKEQDVYSVSSIVSTQIEENGQLILKAGDSRDLIRQRLGDTLATRGSVRLGPNKGMLRFTLDSGRVKTLELSL
jgi:hypothetical protein